MLGRGHISHIVKMHYFFIKSSSVFPGIDQTNQVCSNETKEGSTKIVNFMTLGAGVLVQGRGHISHRVKMFYFFKNLLHISHSEYVFSSFLSIFHIDCYCVKGF